MTLTISKTVIGGEIQTDDYTVKEDGYSCGRILTSFSTNSQKEWYWHINPPVPIHGNRGGKAATKEEAEAQWKAAWAVARQNMSDHDVQHWHQIADARRD